jgi:NAD(P)-dependent dehydrogenase (short-subunit alcohol dehydrogenase family)
MPVFLGTRLMNYAPAPDLLKDRVILVTGAGQGIGKSAALAYARHGATVVLLGRNQKRLDAVYDEIVDGGYPEPISLKLDLAKADDPQFAAMAQAIFEQFGRLDGILHNAARFEGLIPLQSQALEPWLHILRVNLAAPIALTRACWPLLTAAPDASVVFTSETHGHAPAAFWGAFAVSKAGMEAAVKIWSEELAPHPNLRMNTLVPGPVRSPQRLISHPAENREQLASIDSLMPVYLYLMGPDSRGRNGQVFEAQSTDLLQVKL